MTPDERPLLLDRASAEGERSFVDLREQVRGLEVFDTLEAQVGELIRCRRPGPGLSAADVVSEAKRVLGPRPEAYGTWAYYPWSRRLVHVLPESEHAELRTSRNRNKITRAEQQKLGRLKLGIVGLSVGQATAMTLALEGIGGEMRLADFDRLSLSNLNRLRAGVHEIGVNKAVITARAIYEVNPYARIVLFTEGITDANLDGFMDGLDLLFEECDDLAMKIRLREAARSRRIAVLMETSDRGMLDVERFDLEPDRPLLHGLVGSVDAASLRGLTTAEKVPFVLAIIGEISPRGAASLVDIDSTLETWPQLASAVSLGSAINADTARRIALGTFHDSGRFYVDLDRIVGPSDAKVVAAEAHPEGQPRPVARRTAASPPPAEIGTIVRWASLAPSGGNCQPWRFSYRAGDRTLECWHAPERSASMLDYDHRAAHVALGAALENARLACVKLGVGASVARMPGPAGLAWSLRVSPGDRDALARTQDDEVLARAVEERVTNRRLAERRALPAGCADALARVAREAGAELELVADLDAMTRLGEVVARAEKLRMLNPTLHREMVQELRWSPDAARQTADGIDVATLELNAADAAGLHLLRDPVVVQAIRSVGGGEGLKKATRKAVGAASAIGLLRARVDEGGPAATYLRGGEALQRVWLSATARGVAAQPMTVLLYLLARAEDGGGAGLDEEEKAELAALRTELGTLTGPTRGAEIMLMRLHVADPPTARAARRGIGDILSVE